jgi:hypothetical protein
MIPQRWIARSAMVLVLSAGVQADTLYLRDGSRVQGELISVRNGTIEFEERRSYGSGRTLRLDRDEVVRIELEDTRRSGGTGNEFLSGGRPSGLRERQTIVSGDVAWNDSGIEVRAGQTVYFESQGQVRWGKDRRDGPAGERNSPANPGRPMGNRNAAALIGKIGTGNDFFFIGDEAGPVRMRSAGRLYLGINDDVLTDNSGNFRVVVYY